jgi:uncharacterized membrane protein (DUF4010 family)
MSGDSQAHTAMMDIDRDLVLGLLAALGGGLLVGTERERRKGQGQQLAAIGMRTCTLASLTGAVAALFGAPALLVAGVGVVALTLAGYLRSRDFDPGLTTEIALLATFVLGALATTRPQLAAALFVVVTIVLASKESLHRFARHVLSEHELNDALILAASALIVLPLLPDRTIDPFDVLNPRKLWLLAVMVMSVNAAGYVALRALGPGRGLALAGFFGGFVSSTATIAGMAHRARTHPVLRRDCVAGALLSNIATIALLTTVLFAVSVDLLRELAIPLTAAAVAATVVGGLSLWHARGITAAAEMPSYGRAFALHQALLFAAIVATALFGASALRHWLGLGGVFAAAAATGVADVHAAAVTLGQLASSGGISTNDGAGALVIAFTTNSIVKCVAATSGGGAYTRQVVAGILAINATLVAALWLS